MIDLSVEQVAALAQIDTRSFVQGVYRDLLKDDAKLADDPTLAIRLWRAYKAARGLGIRDDENLVAFLRVAAYAPDFYDQPTIRAWLTRPGRPADVRFHDYLRVMRWRIQHPELVRRMKHGEHTRTVSGISSGSTWARVGACWRRFTGRSGNGGNG